MPDNQLRSFLETAKTDTKLQEKLKAAADADSVVAIAKDAGFIFSSEELTKARAEISEEELESVAGGGTYGTIEGNGSIHYFCG